MKEVDLFFVGARSKPVPPPRSHSLETFGKKVDEEKVESDTDAKNLSETSTDLCSSQADEIFGELAKIFELILLKVFFKWKGNLGFCRELISGANPIKLFGVIWSQ